MGRLRFQWVELAAVGSSHIRFSDAQRGENGLRSGGGENTIDCGTDVHLVACGAGYQRSLSVRSEDMNGDCTVTSFTLVTRTRKKARPINFAMRAFVTVVSVR